MISGYLITSILRRDSNWPIVNVASFYERRMRRIAPAILFVIAATFPFAWLWMLPAELNDFGKSVYSVTLGFSNVLFWRETGYFSPANDLKPLLHTWSLAVEEQFYLAFPLLLFALRNFSDRSRIASIAILVTLSFSLTQVIPLYDPVANFYLLPTRFWELGAGCLLALAQSTPQSNRSRRYHATAAMLGLLFIVGAYLLVFETDRYPGWSTLPVVCGTLLVLAYARPSNVAGRILSWKPLVYIGVISYSLYLWHQPIFAVSRLRSFNSVFAGDYVLLICATGVLSVATYKFIEEPFRNRKLLPTRSAMLALCIAGLSLGAVGATFDQLNGLASLRPDITSANARALGLRNDCENTPLSACSSSPQPEIAVWGDSFARHLINGILASRSDAKIVQFTRSKCAPLLGISWEPSNERKSWAYDCIMRNQAIAEHVSGTRSLRFVLVSSPFINSITATSIVKSDGTRESSSYSLILQRLRSTLDYVRSTGAQPIVFAPPPRDGEDHGICVARALKIGVPTSRCDIERSNELLHDDLVARLMGDISEDFPVLDLSKFLCNSTHCKVTDAGVPLYENDGHLSSNGSSHLGKILDFYNSIRLAGTVGCSNDVRTEGAKPHGLCYLTPKGISPAFESGRNSLGRMPYEGHS